MDTIYALLGQYWGIATLIVAVLAYLGVNKTARSSAIKYAENKAITLMFGIEKRAESFLLSEGKQKFDWVVNQGYSLLPPLVRLIISPDAFKAIVQALYDDAVKFVESKQPVPVVTANITATSVQTTTQSQAQG